MKIDQIKLVLSVDEQEMEKYKKWHSVESVGGLVKALLTELPGIAILEISSASKELDMDREEYFNES